MQKIFGSGDPATGRRTQSDPRMKGAGKGRTMRTTRGKVPPGRSRPTVGWGKRKQEPPKSGLQKLVGSVTGRH